MTKFKTLLFFLLVSISFTAQELDIPNTISLTTADDFKKTEHLVLKATDWLANTPVGEHPDKRIAMNGFLMKWMSGSPSVSIALVEGIVPLDCADCLMAFMSGWTKYSLEHNYSDDKLACAVAGAEQAIRFYEKNKAALGKNADMEKLIKQQKKGKLQSYIESKY
jgi:hypothetical protein